MSLLIVGCGYVGHEYASLYRQRYPQERVYALTRSQDNAAQLSRLGIQPIVGHWMDEELRRQPLPEVDRLLVACPHRPDPASGLNEQDPQQHVVGLQNLLSWIGQSKTSGLMLQAVYLSTTGVYGETAAGQIIDEDSPVSPTRIGPCIAVAAENWLSSIQIKAPSVHVLRLAGIYGPGRIPLIQQIRTGQPLEVPKSGLLNLIHLRDIAPAIEWLFATQPARKMYLLSDGHAVERHQFYSYFAELNNCLPPQFVPADQFSTKARRATDKRIDPSRFWKDSELTAIHPSYRSGLRDI